MKLLLYVGLLWIIPSSCTDINECASSPCLHDNLCINTPGSYKCQCRAGYEGPRCNDINECASGPCQFKSMCENTDGSFRCHCKPGFIGKLCTEVFPESATSRVYFRCEYQDMMISCPAGQDIFILIAEYGSWGGWHENICAVSLRHWDCRRDVTRIINLKCFYKNSCSLTVTTARVTVYEDPCPGIRKTFRVEYFCF